MTMMTERRMTQMTTQRRRRTTTERRHDLTPTHFEHDEHEKKDEQAKDEHK